MSANIHRGDCPRCGQPGLVDTSTNFKREWSCNACGRSFHPDKVRARR